MGPGASDGVNGAQIAVAWRGAGSPTGRGSGFKSRSVGVRVPSGALDDEGVEMDPKLNTVLLVGLVILVALVILALLGADLSVFDGGK